MTRRRRPGGVIHLDVEHHANLLPWQRLGSRTVRAGGTRAQTVAAVEAELAAAPAALLAVTGASNVTGECPPLAELTALAHRYGARIVVDGAQLVPHRRVSLAESGIDYLAFSGHKLYAPYGAGVLVGRRDWLESAPPYLAGGGAVREVRLGRTEWADAPARHEAGTPNVIGAVALAAACPTVAALGPDAVSAHESALVGRLTEGLAAIDGVRTFRLWPSASTAGVSRAGPDRRGDVRRRRLPGRAGGPVPVGRARHRRPRRPVLRPPAAGPVRRRRGHRRRGRRPRQPGPRQPGRGRRPAAGRPGVAASPRPGLDLRRPGGRVRPRPRPSCPPGLAGRRSAGSARRPRAPPDNTGAASHAGAPGGGAAQYRPYCCCQR